MFQNRKSTPLSVSLSPFLKKKILKIQCWKDFPFLFMSEVLRKPIIRAAGFGDSICRWVMNGWDEERQTQTMCFQEGSAAYKKNTLPQLHPMINCLGQAASRPAAFLIPTDSNQIPRCHKHNAPLPGRTTPFPFHTVRGLYTELTPQRPAVCTLVIATISHQKEQKYFPQARE